MYLNRIRLEIEKNSLKTLELFLKKSFYNLVDSDNLSNHQRSICKEFRGNTTAVDFSKAFDSILSEKM